MRTTFSRTGHILASAGAAIGVANLVIFPYRVHYFGAGAYVLAFVAFTLLMGVPMMILENAMGKRSGKNPIHAFQATPGDKPYWAWVGWLGMLTSIMVASFYLVLAGWTLDYIWQYLANYGELAARPPRPAVFGATRPKPPAKEINGLF
jgi:NSS family neurotransmitter:Na+ symporter